MAISSELMSSAPSCETTLAAILKFIFPCITGEFLELANQARFGSILFLLHSGQHLDQFPVPPLCLPALLKFGVPPLNGGDVLRLAKHAPGDFIFSSRTRFLCS